ncbi:MAG TPA: alpha/beta fold hydrolase [Gemmatimonadales bacterium]|nr:alpha/beta fold hydrolase [Gemmatimonadales bacterium]
MDPRRHRTSDERLKKLSSGILIGLAAIIGYFALLFLAQRSLLFPAPRIVPLPEPLAGELVRVPGDGAEAVAILLPPAVESGSPAPLMLFMHGNGELADFWIHEFNEPRSRGWAVMLVEYPGYGRAPGSPSEKSITASVLALYDWAEGNPQFDSRRIVAYGRSLGGAAAARLSAERPVSALILESTFIGVRPFARSFLAPGFLVRDPFDTIEALQDYDGPLLVMHGTRDEVVPFEHGKAIAAAVPGAVFQELPCGHNDCEREWEVVSDFLAGSVGR